MTGKQEVFVLLHQNQGSFISGEELAAKIHMSRNGVWKAISALRKEGHQIEAVTNKGYCLLASAGQGDSAPITEAELCSALFHNPLIHSVSVLEEVDSTNRYVKDLARKGAAEGVLVAARRQTSGRGRLSRSFFSPDGGIYMSLLLRPTLPAERAILLTTCAAVAVARAIEKETQLSAGIKWVNDIYLSGKKVCGILTEGGLSFENGSLSYAVLGIGININRVDLPKELQSIVGCLNEFTNKPVDRHSLIASILREFALEYPHLSDAAYMLEYKERSLLLGKEVTVLSHDGEYTALATDIDRDGHLIVLHNGMTESLQSGEVRVRM